ncbi:hypothetical protein ACS0TY_029719 [Phlomoides rotata]
MQNSVPPPAQSPFHFLHTITTLNGFVVDSVHARSGSPLGGRRRRHGMDCESRRVGGRCGQQIEGQRLSSCQRYLRDSSRCEVSPEGIEGGGWREEFPRCCDVLEKINESRRCEAVKKVCVIPLLMWHRSQRGRTHQRTLCGHDAVLTR